MPHKADHIPFSTTSHPRHASLLARQPKLAPLFANYFAGKNFSRTKHLAAALLAASLIIPHLAPAQLPQLLPVLNDPANLTGERVSPQDPADTLPLNHGTPALQQLLLKLRTRASFMLIVAHPDDEDGGLLTYLSRGQGARVAMLTLNRGEGGQNFMSADFDDALGLIRTQELLAADRYMGVDQFFGTEVDFGFSKTKEESFAKWTHERVLYDAVRAVRLYRPLVIASVFVGGPTDGHGQHQVAGQIAQEVFNAAGDPKVFPDQISQGLQPWQPLKVYARVPNARIVTDASGTPTIFDSATNQYVPARFTNYVTGVVTNTLPRANVVIPEGDPATYTAPDGTKTPIPGMDGLSYIQFAREGLALQKTQIGPNARQATPGPHDVAYALYGSKAPCVVQAAQPLPGTPSPSQASQVLLGNPSLQARASQPQPADGALALGACPPSTLEPSVFSGIDTSLPGLADLVPEASDKLRPTLKKIDAQIAEAQRLFNPTHPELTAPPLRTALATLDQFLNELTNPNINDLPSDETYNLLHELRIKRTQLNNALVLANNISVEAFLGQQSKDEVQSEKLLLTSDKHASITVNISNHGTEEIRAYVKKIEAFPQDCSTDIITLDGEAQRPGTSETSHFDFDCKHGFNATRPYFSRSGIEQPYYDVAISDLRNAPTTPSPLRVVVSFEDHEVPLTAEALVQYPAGPMKNQPSIVVPPVSVIVSSRTGLLTPKFACALLDVIVKGNIRQTTGTLSVDRLQGWDTGEPVNFNIANPGEEHREELLANPGCGPDPLEALPKNLPSGSTFTLTAVASVEGKQYREGYQAVGYPGLTYTNYYTPAITRIIPVDVTAAPNLNIAYLPGTGDDLPAALDQLGIHPHTLTAADLNTSTLKPYDAIILGVRAYEAHPELAGANPALNTYAANGGIVIAQYNIGRLPEGTGPYPLSLGDSEKVVEEDAPVEILAPNDPLLTWPNHITSADFDHWLEERGHGFTSTWDPHYSPLLETHDHGQAPQRGGLLVARSGRGAWIYLGLALYRQLPEGVPGAYRILANLISAAKNPALTK